MCLENRSFIRTGRLISHSFYHLFMHHYACIHGFIHSFIHLKVWASILKVLSLTCTEPVFDQLIKKILKEGNDLNTCIINFFVCFYLKLMSAYTFMCLLLQGICVLVFIFLAKKKSSSHAHNASTMFWVLVSLKWIRSLEIFLKQFDFRLLQSSPPVFYGCFVHN